MICYSNFSTLLFDLGNTILPISPEKTISSFLDIGLDNNILTSGTTLVERFQKGAISETTFLNGLKEQLPQGTSIQTIKNAWNSMLLDFPLAHITLLRQLRETHRLLLLSNTNKTHYDCFSNIAKKQGFILDTLFDRTYYSHELKMSKPNPDIFEIVLKEQKVSPKEILFLDDLQENIDTAKKLGLATQLITPTLGILDIPV